MRLFLSHGAGRKILRTAYCRNWYNSKVNEVSIEDLQSRLSLMDERRAHYEWKSEKAEGRLARHEVWRHNYLSYPYLIGAPEERVASRFRDIFINQTELGTNAKIGMLPVDAEDSFMQKFTHMLEEYGARGGGPPATVIQEARKPILRYFENGEPIAVRMFRGYTAPETSFLVKYGRRESLEPMLNEGRIRICPASYYNNEEFGDAIRDNEITRNFFIPTFRERLKGIHFLDFQGHRIEYGNDDIVLPVVMPDYYLFSLCSHIYYRMPTDFGSDAALVIRDPVRFTQCVISNFLAKLPDWEPMHGPVTYYDPYCDYKKITIPEMSKHFGYSYQREVRIALRARRRPRSDLQPEFLTIGSMADYAELLSA